MIKKRYNYMHIGLGFIYLIVLFLAKSIIDQPAEFDKFSTTLIVLWTIPFTSLEIMKTRKMSTES